MSGRPVHLFAAAAIMAAASVASITAASAGCYGCGSFSYSYAAPVAYYTAPVVYSYSYAAPAAYASSAPSCGCGYGSYGYATRAPMYVVNQGPSYAAPVTIDAEPTPAYEEGYRAYPYYGSSGFRWHRRHWHRGYGSRGYGYRGYGYRGYGERGYREPAYGARSFGYRHSWRARHPMVGPGIYRGPRFAVGPRVRFDLPHRARPMHMRMQGPGMVQPRMLGPGPRGPMHGPGPRGPMGKQGQL